MRVDKKELFLITCFAVISAVCGATTITADSIRPSGSGTKTTFTQNVTIAKNLTTTGNTTNSQDFNLRIKNIGFINLF